jgi:malonyl-CoA decarboxylase
LARQPNFLDRALNQVRNWRGGDPSPVGPVTVKPELSESDLPTIRQQIDACLADQGGAVSARLRAAELGRAYLSLNARGRLRFFRLLAEEYDVDVEEIDRASSALAAAEGEQDRRTARERLKHSLTAPRVYLLTQFNSLERGVKFLVDMRAELLGLLSEHPELRPVDADLKDLLRGWFDVGFLDMAQITFNSPASLLEKLIDYEAVHEIRSWSDLKNRLDSDRRCFSFVHPNMPDEPLIFVEVALVNGMADNVQSLLDEDAPPIDPDAADTAIFYSISNCQSGLAGVGFGDFLIKRVVDRLSQRLPNLKTFATLSPMPGFRRWLDGRIEEGEEGLLTESEARLLSAMMRADDGHAALKALLSDPDWPREADLSDAARPALMRLGARYLSSERDGRGRPFDPVARFHLNNGARIERINWLGDRSASGMHQSAGLMVNYLYKLDQIERNHEMFRGEGAIVASAAVRRMARGS